MCIQDPGIQDGSQTIEQTQFEDVDVADVNHVDDVNDDVVDDVDGFDKK